MSVDPKEAAAFANILGKLDGVQQGTETVDVDAGRTKRMADNDMTSILSAFNNTSGTASALTLTPEALTESKETVDEKVDDPYAIGMAQAMKSTGDKPPLKKSTITKAHEIAKAVAKEETNEDSLSDIKKQLTDYLSDIKASDDKDLAPKKQKEDHLGKPIKTMKINGKTVKLHGNEDDGFRLKVNEKLHSATFKNLEQALMACEAYMNRGK